MWIERNVHRNIFGGTLMKMDFFQLLTTELHKFIDSKI